MSIFSVIAGQGLQLYKIGKLWEEFSYKFYQHFQNPQGVFFCIFGHIVLYINSFLPNFLIYKIKGGENRQNIVRYSNNKFFPNFSNYKMKKRKKKVGNWHNKNSDIKKNRNSFLNIQNHFLKQYLLNTVKIEEHKEPWKNFFHSFLLPQNLAYMNTATMG